MRDRRARAIIEQTPPSTKMSRRFIDWRRWRWRCAAGKPPKASPCRRRINMLTTHTCPAGRQPKASKRSSSCAAAQSLKTGRDWRKVKRATPGAASRRRDHSRRIRSLRRRGLLQSRSGGHGVDFCSPPTRIKRPNTSSMTTTTFAPCAASAIYHDQHRLPLRSNKVRCTDASASSALSGLRCKPTSRWFLFFQMATISSVKCAARNY